MFRVLFTCAGMLCAYSVTAETQRVSWQPHRTNMVHGDYFHPNVRSSSQHFPPSFVAMYEERDDAELPPPATEDVDLSPGVFSSFNNVQEWKDRPQTIPGTSRVHPMPKCCPRGQRLEENLQRCENFVSGGGSGSGSRDGSGTGGGNGGGGGRGSRDGNDVGGGAGGWHKLPLDTEGEARFPPCESRDTLRLGAVEAAVRVRQTMDESLRLTVRALSNGTVEVAVGRSEFCADDAAGSAGPFAFLLCPCAQTACVRKCCASEQALVVKELSMTGVAARCEDLPKDLLGPWMPRVDARQQPQGGMGNKKGYAVLMGAWPSQCKKGWTRVPPSWSTPHPGSDFQVFPDGLGFVRSNPPEELTDFCVDRERAANGSLVESIVYCARPRTAPTLDRWLSVLGVVSALALAVSLFVYVMLPDLRASPFSRALMAYASSLLLLAVVGLAWTLQPDLGKPRCIFNVVWSTYFQLAAAFWLNVMCFDMGVAFRSYQGPLERRGQVATRIFIRYSCYAWGCPLLAIVPLLALQFTQPSGSPWRPIQWFMACHFSHPPTQFMFLYAPMLILLVLNLGIFVWTAWKIRMLQKDTEILTEDDPNESSPYPQRKQLLLFLKLLWVMGVMETLLEIIVWAGSTETAHWHMTNVVDTSRAFCILCLSCWKRRVLQRLSERFGCRTNRVAPSGDTDTGATSSTVVQSGSSVKTRSRTASSNANGSRVAASKGKGSRIVSYEATGSRVAAASESGSRVAAASDATGSRVASSQVTDSEDTVPKTPSRVAFAEGTYAQVATAKTNAFRGDTLKAASMLDRASRIPPGWTIIESEEEREDMNNGPPQPLEMRVISTTSL